MLALFDGSFRWTDPGTWPWIIYFWLAALLVGRLKPLWKWLQREQAKSWPTTTGQITSAYVSEPKGFFHSGRHRTYDVVLEYSYQLSGETFRGEYKRNVGSEDEAYALVRGLKDQIVPVQYNTNKPARSALLELTVETLLRNRPPEATSTDDRDANPLPSWKRLLFTLGAVFSFVGLILSLWVHIGALLGRRVAPEYFFWGLHMGIFVVFLPAVFLTQKKFGFTNRSDYWKVVTKGLPDGMRYLLYFFFAYAFVNFALFFVAQFPAGKESGLSPLVWRGFSGHWMVFYYSSFLTHLSALNSSQRDSPAR